MALVSSPKRVFRVAKTSYGPLSPLKRAEDSDPIGWSRFDTPGRTVYAADSRLTAYLEMLAPFRTAVADQRRALQGVADALAIDLEDLWQRIFEEWDEQGNMHAMWLPRAFREGRAMYTLRFPAGWWVDIHASETLSALHDLFPHGLRLADGTLIRDLTLSQLTSDSRELTTAIASTLRFDTELDDGSLPLGISFTSKHGHPSGGSGKCWSYWQRNVDNGMAEPTEVLNTALIREDDSDLNMAQLYCKIKLR